MSGQTNEEIYYSFLKIYIRLHQWRNVPLIMTWKVPGYTNGEMYHSDMEGVRLHQWRNIPLIVTFKVSGYTNGEMYHWLWHGRCQATPMEKCTNDCHMEYARLHQWRNIQLWHGRCQATPMEKCTIVTWKLSGYTNGEMYHCDMEGVRLHQWRSVSLIVKWKVSGYTNGEIYHWFRHERCQGGHTTGIM